MPKTQPTDRSNWRRRSHPWIKGRDFSTEENAEVDLFKMQERFRLEREERHRAFEENIRMQRQAFEVEEDERWFDMIYPFCHQLWVCLIPIDPASTCNTNVEY
jgi:hypothetical protein